MSVHYQNFGTHQQKKTKQKKLPIDLCMPSKDPPCWSCHMTYQRQCGRGGVVQRSLQREKDSGDGGK